jgi:GMP synthase (glutamine-hydrolysing)
LTTKPFLILQHFAGNPPGRVGIVLNERSIPFDVLQVEQDTLSDSSAYGAIIALGGTQHLYEKARYPYTRREERYLHDAVTNGIPYLGMCLGGQLLANAFDAPVQKLPKELIGFLTIHFTVAGQHDPLYQGLSGTQQAFQWHEDCFLLPRGSIELARHQDSSNQSFRYLEHAYGIQYHIEITEQMFDEWLHTPSLKKEFVDAYGTERYEQTEQKVGQLYPLYDSQARQVIENFIHLSLAKEETHRG